MRRTILIGCLILLPLLTGCSVVSDLLFGAFGGGYTGGGDTYADKKSHYDAQREASDHYKPWNE
jgi:hypothetical protein